jgi:hypothetical protein
MYVRKFSQKQLETEPSSPTSAVPSTNSDTKTTSTSAPTVTEVQQNGVSAELQATREVLVYGGLPPLDGIPPSSVSKANSNYMGIPVFPAELKTPKDNETSRVNEERLSRLRKIARTTNLNVKEGWLKKRGKIRKNWKERWFVLKPDGFYYYTSPKEYIPLNVLPMNEIVVVDVITQAEMELLNVPDPLQWFFHFKVMTPKRELFVAATSKDEREDWVLLAKDAIKLRTETS